MTGWADYCFCLVFCCTGSSRLSRLLIRPCILLHWQWQTEPIIASALYSAALAVAGWADCCFGTVYCFFTVYRFWLNGKVACVAGLFFGLWCIAVIQEQASPIYLHQHKSAQPSTANVVESIAPPISSHIPTACSCCVPGKGELEGEKRANAI